MATKKKSTKPKMPMHQMPSGEMMMGAEHKKMMGGKKKQGK